MNNSEIIPNLFRTEYSKLIAVLCKVYGLQDIQIAEDIVADTFLAASETWGKRGLPDNQVGWLYTVAKNKTKDYLRRNQLRVNKVEKDVKMEPNFSLNAVENLELNEGIIQDSQLKMLFTACDPSIPKDAQIALALRVLCGFGIAEIASALLSNKEAINKKLFRAKAKLRESGMSLDLPPPRELSERLAAVLTTLYLLFNEGYYSSNPDFTLNKDMCLEAMRLNLLLVSNNLTRQPQVHALLALMCFHASRFEARIDGQGDFVLYDEQDSALWNKELMEKGDQYLNLAAAGEKLSKYHLEAAIAYWHTQPDKKERWESILQLYNFLLQLDYSPIAALNRTYALSKANGPKEAIAEALKLQLDSHHLYHSLLADLYHQIGNPVKRKKHLNSALNLAKTNREKSLIQKKLDST